jgi:hypothetical protein
MSWQNLLQFDTNQVGKVFTSLHRTEQQQVMNAVVDIIRAHKAQHTAGRYDGRSKASAEWAATVELPEGEFPFI